MIISAIQNISAKSISQNNQKINFDGKFYGTDIETPKKIKPLYAYRDYAAYRPLIHHYNGYSIPVHNVAIGERMKGEYNLDSFQNLMNFAVKKGTFQYALNPDTGFVKTSFINHGENPLMSDLIWITDTCNNMELVKHFNPKDCTRVFNKLTDFYAAEQYNFDKAIEHPELYKNNGIFPMDTKCGVGHCFVPDTKKPHKWFALTRLESVGNYLQVANDLIINGFNGANYGYKSADEVPDKVINAMSSAVKYLKAINYPAARSCGAWEEQTFVNSLTSDTAIINQAFRKILNLMYKPTKDKNILALRERLINSKHGNVFLNEQALRKLLAKGEKRIKEQPDLETTQGDFAKKLKPWEEKALKRDYDSAMSFMIQTETLDDDVRLDSIKKLKILKKLENNLVKANGAIRYKGDIYLNLDYHTLKNPTGDNKHKNEAEWFLVSEMASAYGAVVKNLIEYMKSNKATQIDKKILEYAVKKQTEYINRSYARISPRRMTKANGYTNTPYKVPEAYQAVTLKNGKIKYVPGAHPLTWAASSLHKASRIFIENLKELENLNIN